MKKILLGLWLSVGLFCVGGEVFAQACVDAEGRKGECATSSCPEGQTKITDYNGVCDMMTEICCAYPPDKTADSFAGMATEAAPPASVPGDGSSITKEGMPTIPGQDKPGEGSGSRVAESFAAASAGDGAEKGGPGTADFTIEILTTGGVDLRPVDVSAYDKKAKLKLPGKQLSLNAGGEGYSDDETVMTEVRKFQDWYNNLKGGKCKIKEDRTEEIELVYNFPGKEPVTLKRAPKKQIDVDGKHGPDTETARLSIENRWLICPDEKVKEFQEWYNDNCEVLPRYEKKKTKPTIEGDHEKMPIPPQDLDPSGFLDAKTSVAKKAVDAGWVGCPPLCKGGGNTPPIFQGLLPGPAASDDAVCYVGKKLLPSVTSGVLVFLLGISVLMVIVGGIVYLTSMGNTEMLTKGRDIIAWAIVGSVIAILSYTIVKFIINIDYLGPEPKPPKPPAVEAPAPKKSDEKCDIAPASLKNPPESCYEGDVSGTQNSKAGECKALEQLQPFCADLGVSGKCDVKAIQQALKSGDHYKDDKDKPLPANCSAVDGKYGKCTKQALDHFYKGKGCEKGSGKGEGKAEGEKEEGRKECKTDSGVPGECFAGASSCPTGYDSLEEDESSDCAGICCERQRAEDEGTECTDEASTDTGVCRAVCDAGDTDAYSDDCTAGRCCIPKKEEPESEEDKKGEPDGEGEAPGGSAEGQADGTGAGDGPAGGDETATEGGEAPSEESGASGGDKTPVISPPPRKPIPPARPGEDTGDAEVSSGGGTASTGEESAEVPAVGTGGAVESGSEPLKEVKKEFDGYAFRVRVRNVTTSEQKSQLISGLGGKVQIEGGRKIGEIGNELTFQFLNINNTDRNLARNNAISQVPQISGMTGPSSGGGGGFNTVNGKRYKVVGSLIYSFPPPKSTPGGERMQEQIRQGEEAARREAERECPEEGAMVRKKNSISINNFEDREEISDLETCRDYCEEDMYTGNTNTEIIEEGGKVYCNFRYTE